MRNNTRPVEGKDIHMNMYMKIKMAVWYFSAPGNSLQIVNWWWGETFNAFTSSSRSLCKSHSRIFKTYSVWEVVSNRLYRIEFHSFGLHVGLSVWISIMARFEYYFDDMSHTSFSNRTESLRIPHKWEMKINSVNGINRIIWYRFNVNSLIIRKSVINP